jgi:hypothetical protein
MSEFTEITPDNIDRVSDQFQKKGYVLMPGSLSFDFYSRIDIGFAKTGKLYVYDGVMSFNSTKPKPKHLRESEDDTFYVNNTGNRIYSLSRKRKNEKFDGKFSTWDWVKPEDVEVDESHSLNPDGSPNLLLHEFSVWTLDYHDKSPISGDYPALYMENDDQAVAALVKIYEKITKDISRDELNYHPLSIRDLQNLTIFLEKDIPDDKEIEEEREWNRQTAQMEIKAAKAGIDISDIY